MTDIVELRAMVDTVELRAMVVKFKAMVTAMQEKIKWVQAWQEEIQIRLEALESANMPTDEELLARKRYNERLQHSGEHEGQAEEED